MTLVFKLQCLLQYVRLYCHLLHTWKSTETHIIPDLPSDSKSETQSTLKLYIMESNQVQFAETIIIKRKHIIYIYPHQATVELIRATIIILSLVPKN